MKAFLMTKEEKWKMPFCFERWGFISLPRNLCYRNLLICTFFFYIIRNKKVQVVHVLFWIWNRILRLHACLIPLWHIISMWINVGYFPSLNSDKTTWDHIYFVFFLALLPWQSIKSVLLRNPDCQCTLFFHKK